VIGTEPGPSKAFIPSDVARIPLIEASLRQTISTSALPCPRIRESVFKTFVVDGNFLSSMASFRSSTFLQKWSMRMGF